MRGGPTILCMAIESFDDLLQQLDDHPEWRQRLQSVVLTDRLLALPDIVADLAVQVGALAERMDALTERMDALTVRMDALTGRVEEVAELQRGTEMRLQGLIEQVSGAVNRSDEALGYVVEERYRNRAHAHFQTIARRIRVLSPDALDDLLEPAVDGGTLTEDEAAQVRWADAVISGRRDGEVVYLVLEASYVVDDHDVDRAARRARIVAKLGSPALPVVAGRKILPRVPGLAGRMGVWVVSNGHVEAPPAA